MKVKTRHGSLLYRMLTVELFRTSNRHRVMRSRWMFAQDERGYVLRPIGVLHTLFGLVLDVRDE